MANMNSLHFGPNKVYLGGNNFFFCSEKKWVEDKVSVARVQDTATPAMIFWQFLPPPAATYLTFPSTPKGLLTLRSTCGGEGWQERCTA